MAKTWDKFNLTWGLEEYDQKFSLKKNLYAESCKFALWLASIKEKETIADIGSGTGISTVLMADSNPNLEKIICIDPGEAIEVAKHKFNHINLFDKSTSDKTASKSRFNLSQEYLIHLEENRERMLPFKDKTVFHNIPSQEISDYINKGIIQADSAHKIYCMSSFHWLANDEVKEETKAEHVVSSLRGFYSLLRNTGKLVFNESGLQFDFGDETITNSGSVFHNMTINSIHFLQQEFHSRFLDNLVNTLRKKVSTQINIDPTKIDDYHHLFNERNLTYLLTKEGFELEKIRKDLTSLPQTKGIESINQFSDTNNCLVSIFREEPQEWQRMVVTGGNMRYFNQSEELRNIPVPERTKLLQEAYDTTVRKHENIMNRPYGETFATFVAEKTAR
nr:hypothetical protein [Nanoarchaeota archaeon]